MSKSPSKPSASSSSGIIKSPSSLRIPSSHAHPAPSRVQFDQPSRPVIPGSSHTTNNSVSTAPRRPSTTTGTKKKMRVDVATPSMERNFVTEERAMADFLLTQDDLEGLRRTNRRSPYADSPEIVVLSRKDVVQRSNQKWGSPERLFEELQKKIHCVSRSVSGKGTRRLPRDERRRRGEDPEQERRELGLWGSSGRVVVAAIAMNCGCLVLKLVAWYYSKSHSMFSEFLHSLADTANQVIIAIGVHTSTKRPNVDHPYGFSNLKFVSALISGVGIFCVGTGLSLYHGVLGLMDQTIDIDLSWAFIVMGVSGMLEVTTLFLAVRSLRLEARKRNMPFMAFGKSSVDPSVNVVLTEDLAAVVSLLVASSCLLLTHYTGSSIPDAVGSLLVGIVLGAVAVFIIVTNVGRLVGRSIPKEQLQQINMELERDVMVRAIHDVKGIDMGNNMVRYKAELDFDGRQLARAYLDQVNMAHLHEAVRSLETMEALEEFMLDHGESLVDMIGGQIDRIERKLKATYPSLRHCDLEIL